MDENRSYRELQRAFVEIGEQVGADDPTAIDDVIAGITDLRRQLAEAQERQVVAMRERDSLRGMLTGCREAIGAADNAQLLVMCEEAADLRRQIEVKAEENRQFERTGW